MPFVASNPYEGMGKVLDNGHCMRHVQIVANVPHSSKLRAGVYVNDTENIPTGTVIGTFGPGGRYMNATDGSSHVAILIKQHDDRSIRVVDQWVGQPVHERTIVSRCGTGKPVNDADAYRVVEAVEE